MKPRIAQLISLLLLVALAATCTYWFLQFGSMRVPPEPLVTVVAGDRMPRTQPIDTAAAAALFGAAASTGPSRIRLTGVIAQGGKGLGVALLSVDGQPATAYRVGESIDADMILTEVRSDGIVVRTAQGTRDVPISSQSAPVGIAPVR